jgi:predicted GNAT family N-acyltransferase
MSNLHDQYLYMTSIRFREPASENELRELLQFRQSIYAQTETLKTMVQKSDLSAFDTHAFHFAAYDGSEPVAYMRMVQASETKFAAWIKNIAGKDLEPAKTNFPFEHYSPDKAWNKLFLQRFQSKKIGEAGKLAIDKAYRSDQFLEQFVRTFLQYCISENHFDSGFGVCTFSLERFYKRFGFYRPLGAVPFVYGGLPEAVVVQFDAETNSRI